MSCFVLFVPLLLRAAVPTNPPCLPAVPDKPTQLDTVAKSARARAASDAGAPRGRLPWVSFMWITNRCFCCRFCWLTSVDKRATSFFFWRPRNQSCTDSGLHFFSAPSRFALLHKPVLSFVFVNKMEGRAKPYVLKCVTIL